MRAFWDGFFKPWNSRFALSSFLFVFGIYSGAALLRGEYVYSIFGVVFAVLYSVLWWVNK